MSTEQIAEAEIFKTAIDAVCAAMDAMERRITGYWDRPEIMGEIELLRQSLFPLHRHLEDIEGTEY